MGKKKISIRKFLGDILGCAFAAELFIGSLVSIGNASAESNVLLLVSKDSPVLNYIRPVIRLSSPSSEIDEILNEKETLKRIKEGYLSQPLLKKKGYVGSVYLEGLSGEYKLRVRMFKDKKEFFGVFLQRYSSIDELIISCHGKPMYLQGEGIASCNVENDLTYEQLKNDFQKIVLESNSFFDMGWFKKHHCPSGDFKDKIISVEDLRAFKEKDKIRSKFREKSRCQLRACLGFYNLGKGEEYPSLGVELAKFLNIPVIGSVPELNYFSGGVYREHSEKLVTAIPDGYGNVRIE